MEQEASSDMGDMGKYCEVTWGIEPLNEYLTDPCPNDGEYIAVSIADQTRHVFVVCEKHRKAAEAWPNLWLTAKLPLGSKIGTIR